MLYDLISPYKHLAGQLAMTAEGIYQVLFPTLNILPLT